MPNHHHQQGAFLNLGLPPPPAILSCMRTAMRRSSTQWQIQLGGGGVRGVRPPKIHLPSGIFLLVRFSLSRPPPPKERHPPPLGFGQRRSLPPFFFAFFSCLSDSEPRPLTTNTGSASATNCVRRCALGPHETGTAG